MKKDFYNLTSAQNSIWLTEQFGKGTNINNLGGYVLIKDQVNFELLEKALNFYIKKNDALNLRIKVVNGEPKQFIKKYSPFKLDLFNLENMEEVKSFNQKIVDTPFTITNSQLFRFTMFRLPNGIGGFNVTLHHLIADAWSISLLLNEVITFYSSLLKNEYISDDIFPSYIDYISSEQEYVASTRFQKDHEFWNSVFDTEPEPSYIVPDNTGILNSLAGRKAFQLDTNIYNELNVFCKEHHCSIYTFFMAIYSIYLSKVNNITAPIIGTPVLNRSNFREKHTSGMFISTVPFKISMDFDMPFKDFLGRVANTQMSIFRHQRYPYDILLNDLKKKYNYSHNLYYLALSYQNARDNSDSADINYSSEWLFNGHSLDTLQIHFYDMDNTGILDIYYDYQTSKFNEQDIIDLNSRIMEMVSFVLHHSDVLLKDIEIVSPDEKNKIINVFNQSEVSHPRNINIYDLVEQIGNKNPNHNAIVDYNGYINYQELITKSDQIAKNLIKHNIKKSDCVAVLFGNKSIDLICSLLGILKAGACFLAIYPDYPNDRIHYMIENSNSKLIITDPSFSYMNFNIPSLYINDLEYINEDIVFPKVLEDDNAYLIYTSGSTGKPKGTMQTHNNLINFVYSFNHFLDNSICPEDAMLSVTNICFDVSVAEIFTPLVLGATLFLYKDLNYSNPHELVQYIMENHITFSYFPPSMLQSIYDDLRNYDHIPLNKLLVGVEPIKASTLQSYLSLNPDMKIVNGYGPSETTICCTMYKFNKDIEPTSITPIGKPIGNSKILLYDSTKQLVPIGNIGEIYVQGECVGNGYINNPEMTQERFDLQNRIYRTGDLAKWLPDGNLLFIGRNDNQVKYRGYRIDLGEIEHCIKNIDYIENCIVLLDNHIEGNPILVGFVVANNNSKPSEDELRNSLSLSLPHYMIPNQFIFVDKFPLTPNGKVDRKSLLGLISHSKDVPYVAPSTDLEKKLVNLWCTILEKEQIGINDNFFAIGGDSLSAIKIATLASQDGISISAQSFYTYPTISLLLKHCINQSVAKSNHNYIRSLSIEKNELLSLQGNVLLIGSTGFLGSHILYELIQKTNTKIYCLIRGNSDEHAKSRLKERIHYYFGKQLDSYFDRRIIVMSGDFAKKNLGISESNYKILVDNIKTVINSAAIVKHIGDYNYFYEINILGVESLIHFCKDCNNAHLVHMSTLSVSGDYCNIDGLHSFTEKDLFIDQNIDENVYIKTKFEAEQLLANSILNGLNATIFRLGNITWRSSDGVFQINEKENFFYTLLDFITKIKKLPMSCKDKIFNISPVNDCASLIISILLHANRDNIYHIYNFNTLTLKDIVDILNQLNYNIEFVSDQEYKDILSDGFINYPYVVEKFINSNLDSNIIVDSPITIEIAKELNFGWTNIDANYMKKKLGGIK